MAGTTASLYGSVADYFGQSGTTKSNGKSGGTSGSASQNSGGDATSGGGQSSGSGWISAAVGLTESDKSAFTTTLSNWQGGITNNQIIASPGATGATNVSSPDLSGASAGAASGSGAGGAGVSPILVLLIAFAGMALVLYAKGRG